MCDVLSLQESADEKLVALAAVMANSPETSNRFQVLCWEQVGRLHNVLQEAVPVHGRGNFPTLNITLKDLVQVVRKNLKADGIVVRDIRLNGGAASFVLGNEDEQLYNDLDLIFGVDLSSQADLNKVKSAVLNSLVDVLPDGVSKEKMSSCSLKEAYVQKMVKVWNDNDRWSLIALSNTNTRRNVELKFVQCMKRQFEFSVDSFQIILDSLLTFYDVSEKSMSEHFYPTVVAESVYGDFNEALCHLNKKLISTRCPEEIRGGGLLKYCNLLVREYLPAGDVDIKALERYMCSRFFIDFPDIAQQRLKLENYLANHFKGDEQMRYDYLVILASVVDDSTICLMGHERRQTLLLIQQLATQVQLEQEAKAYNKSLLITTYDSSSCGACFDPQSNLIIDQVYYGPFYSTGDQYYTTYTYLPGSAYPTAPQVTTTGPPSPPACPSCPLCPVPAYQVPCS